MPNPSDDELDEQLAEWATRTQATPEQLARLQKQIVSGIGDQLSASDSENASGITSSHSPRFDADEEAAEP